MCWSLGASVGMVALGCATTYLARRKGLPTALWVTLGFFTAMEALQAAGYLVINECDSFANRAITLASYLHIAFQPAFINAIALELVPAGVRRRIRFGVYAVCALCTAFMLLQLVPFEWAGTCRIGECMCSRQLCSRSGDWHIAWDVPYNGLGTWIEDKLGVNWGMPAYMFAVFVLPAAYGSWRFPLLNLLVGPVFGNLVTTDNNEVPAIWCLFSIAIITTAFFPPLLDYFRVNSWPLWPRRWTISEAPA